MGSQNDAEIVCPRVPNQDQVPDCERVQHEARIPAPPTARLVPRASPGPAVNQPRRSLPSLQRLNPGLQIAEGEGHAGMPGRGTVHLRRMIGNNNSVKAILLQNIQNP